MALSSHDCFGHHDSDGFAWDRAGSVDDRDDDDEGKGVDSSKPFGIGAFGDTAEPVRRSDCHSGLGGFLGVKLELDFHCRAAMEGYRNPSPSNLSKKKSSIGGNRYLDYL